MTKQTDGDADVKARLQSVLARELTRPAIGPIARSLGMSVRTLQRRLREEGTSFERQVAFARVCAAKRLMKETSGSLSSIALDVGFASLARLSVVFRRLEGTSPSAWRRRSGA